MTVNISSDVRAREKEVRKYIVKHADTFGLDANLIRALITQESRFIAEATSPTGAYGLGQFTGIGARQVQNIANMSDCPDPAGLGNFTKGNASDPDLGIKAICATLWWLFNKKYRSVSDKKIQLEAVLTFYNSGGKAAHLIIKQGGHAHALADIKALPGKYRSQAVNYAPEVAQWYIAWHTFMKPAVETKPEAPVSNPFEETSNLNVDVRYRVLIEALRALSEEAEGVDMMLSSREGLTEITLILPGEYSLNAPD